MPNKHKKSPTLSPQDFLDRLQAHPELYTEFEEILDLVDNRAGDTLTADQAEELAAQRLQRLGQQIIENWAQRKHDLLQRQSDARSDLTRKQKKESTGTPAMAKSKS
jgi:hypothetical protein